jgi:hypothetical protein
MKLLEQVAVPVEEGAVDPGGELSALRTRWRRRAESA